MDELDDFIEETETEVELDPSITWKNVWFSILYKPNPTFDFIFHTDRKKHLWAIWLLLGTLSGLIQLIDAPQLAKTYEPLYVLGIILGVGIVIVGFYALMSLTLKYVGTWIFKTKSTFIDLMIVQAWAVMPSMMSLLLQIVVSLLMLFVHPAGIHGQADLPEFASVMVGFARNVALVWSIVLTIIGVRHLQKLSYGKSIANYLISSVAIITLVFGISMSIAYYYQRFVIHESSQRYLEMNDSYEGVIDPQ